MKNDAVLDATNTMDSAGIMNKWFAYRIQIYMSKKNGVAGGEHAETLAKSVHGQQECPEDVPVWHTLNTSPSHGSCSRACTCEGQTGMATEG